MSYCLNPSCPSPQNPDGTNFCLSCGTKLLLRDRYRGMKSLGQGGFGKTFLAVDEDKPSHPYCVIKQFLPQTQGKKNLQKAAELFNQEAIRLDELGKHAQIPELLAYFSQEGQQYLVQEFIEGENLAQALATQGTFDEAQIRAILHDLLPVLQFVHQHQVIHRDIKPENIISRNLNQLGKGGVKGHLVLVDFGASKLATGTALARTGTVIGSAGYASPEQAIGRAVFASDLYSLGVTCIHLLTQMHPFDLFDAGEGVWVWRDVLSHPVSDALGGILDKMIASPINQRYQSAAEVMSDLQAQMPARLTKKPPQPVKPVKSVKPQPIAKQYSSKIDQELTELRSEFLGTPTPQKPSQKSTTGSSANRAKSPSQIDLELEEIKSQFLGSDNEH
ncbi:MAG: serine/threonine protein kinase [Symploca sp. SIO3E6]|nr:serine/threonine protein kinase [Caldora sp. SIO3E6]